MRESEGEVENETEKEGEVEDTFVSVTAAEIGIEGVVVRRPRVVEDDVVEVDW